MLLTSNVLHDRTDLQYFYLEYERDLVYGYL